MKKHLYTSRLLAIVAFSMVAVSSLAQSAPRPGQNPMFRHLPPNAQDVYHINLPVLTSKLSWEDLTGRLPFFQKASQNLKWLEILKDPALAGIDIHGDIFFALANNEVMDSTGYITFIIHLTDSGKFISYLRQSMPGIRLFNFPGKGRGAGKDVTGFAWDKDLAVMTIIRPSVRERGKGAGATGSAHPSRTAPTFSPAIGVKAARQSLAALHGFDGSFYTTDPVFTSGFSDDADLHIWAAQGTGVAMIMKNLLHTKTGSPASGIAEGTKQPRTLSAVRFDAGKITMHTTTVVSPDLAPIFAQFNSHPLNTDLLTRIPSGNILAMVNLHFEPSAILAVLDKFKVRHKLDSALAAKDLTLDDVQRAFRGDFLLAAIQPPQHPADSPSMEQSKKPDIFFVTTIGDGQSLAKVASRLKLLNDPSKKDEGTNEDSTGAAASASPGMLGKLKSAFTLQDNLLVISRNKMLTDSYFSNKEKRNTDFVTQGMKDSPFSLYLDFRSVAAFVKGMSPEPSDKDRQLLHLLQSFDQLIFTFGGLKGNESESMFELKMTDPSENSLRTLFKLMH